MNKKFTLLSVVGFSLTLTSCNLVGLGNTSNPNLSDSEMQYIAQVYEFLKENYYEDIDQRTLLDGMIYGLTDSFGDPYTFYTSTVNGEEQDLSSSGVGLGFSRIMYYGEAYVEQVMKDSPAERGGLKDKDIIYKVRNVSVDGTRGEDYILKDHNSSDWSNAFLGASGTQIEVFVKRKNSDGVYVALEEPLLVTRGTYNVDKVKLMEFTNVDGYSEAYVTLSSFLGDESAGESTPQDELKDVFDTKIFVNGLKKLNHLIIDLRGNGGGYVSNCIDTLGLFIPKGKSTGYYQYADGTYASLDNNNVSKQYTSQIDHFTLIVDSDTASAGESFAVGLRDSQYTKDKVSIVGQTSYGKGVAQTFVSLFNDGSLIRYTFAKVCSPSKECINKRGIVPDVFLGHEYIPYEKYVRYIPGVTSNDLLSERDTSLILKRINLLLGSGYKELEDAILAFRKVVRLEKEENNSLYDEEFASKLQDKMYDNVILYSSSNIYTGHVEPAINNDYLSSAQRIFIKDKINYVLGENYNTFDKALKAFQEKYNIVNEEGIYDKTTADLLQGLSMDLHFEVYEKDVIEQIKELYGSKKI